MNVDLNTIKNYSHCTETGRPSVPPGYPRVLCFRGGHCRGRVSPPLRGVHPAPTVRLREGLASCWPVLLTVRRLYTRCKSCGLLQRSLTGFYLHGETERLFSWNQAGRGVVGHALSLSFRCERVQYSGPPIGGPLVRGASGAVFLFV